MVAPFQKVCRARHLGARAFRSSVLFAPVATSRGKTSTSQSCCKCLCGYRGCRTTRNLVLGVCVQNSKTLWAQRDCNGFLKINNTPWPVFGFRDSHSELSPGRKINVIREQITNNTHGPGLCQKMLLLQGKVNQQSQQQKASVTAHCLGKSARGWIGLKLHFVLSIRKEAVPAERRGSD